MIKYLAFDPGETTGWAAWDDSTPPVAVDFGQVKGRDALGDLLDEPRFGTVETIIIEQYTIFTHKLNAHAGSKVETIRVIGALEFWAFSIKPRPKIVMQPANVLPIALKWANKKMPSNHANSHWLSAYVHGHYYLVKNGLSQIVRD